MRHFLSFVDLSPNELESVLDRAASLKAGATSDAMLDRIAVMLFEKPSLRTKLSFTVAARKLGGEAIYFGGQEVGLGYREPAADVARVVSRMADVAIVRTFAQATLEDFASCATIPVVNALTDNEHPCQALADLLSIKEVVGDLKAARVVYVGDGNNVASSLALALASSGAHYSIASPDGYDIPRSVITLAERLALKTGASINEYRDAKEAVQDANIVYTDVWTSMGQEDESTQRRAIFADYAVTPALLDLARKDVRFMHDLPAHPGEEITPGLLDDPRSIVFDQAENRLWAQAALLELLVDRN